MIVPVKVIKVKGFCLHKEKVFLKCHHHHHHCQYGSPWPSLATRLYRPSLREVFKAISCISTELLYIGSSWSSCLCPFMWRGPQEYVAYEFVLTSPAVTCMSGSSNFDSFRDGWWVAVQLLFCEVLPPGFAAFLCSCRQAFSPYV